MRRPRPVLLLLAALAFACLGGCGAGLITGIAASGGGNGGGETTPPGLSVAPVLPLVPPPSTVRSIVVTNAQLAGAASLEVRLVAAGVTVVQPNASASTQGGSTLITFVVDTAGIVAAVGDPSAADVPAELSVWVDGRAAAPAVPIALARQPRAALVLSPGVTQRFLSPFGERVAVRVDGLRSTSPSDLQVLVTTPDPDANVPSGASRPTITRFATDIVLEPPVAGAPVVSAFVPGSTFPVGAELVVRDFVAGESTTVTNAYYRPDVALALPSQGPSTGGSLVTLIGTALVPHDFTGGAGPAPFDFDAVQISFAKGGRTTQLEPQDFRIAESGSDRLVFTMPPSPDGRPGQVDIVLRVDLGGAFATVTASQRFLFANPDPFYGPRGAVLDQLPVAAVPIPLDNAPSTAEAPDFAVLTDQGGVAFLQLLLAQQNGMFQPFAAARQIGDHEIPDERNPRDLCVGDFDGDGIPDLFVVNEGAAAAVHHLVLGQERPLPPLGVVHRVPAAPGSYRGRVADFDGDGLPDVLLVPGPTAPPGLRPHVRLARPVGPGMPQFSLPIELPVRSFAYEAVEVADLDGDGALDVAVVSGTELKFDVAYGNGDGTFGAGVPLDFDVPGYTADPASPAVGLHACRDGVRQSLGLVLAGVQFPGPTPPAIVVLAQEETSPGVFGFVDPEPQNVYAAPVEPIGRSLVADLDDVPPIELVVAMRGDPQLIALGLLQLGATAFEPVTTSIEGGVLSNAEAPLQIRALAFDAAFPATQLSGEARAVFLVHEVVVDGVRERRLSTRLVAVPQPSQPILLPPDAGGTPGFAIEGVVGGNFDAVSVAGGGAVRDLALVAGAGSSEEVVLFVNDGFGGFAALGNRLQFPGLLPGSLALAPAPAGVVDGLVFCRQDSALGFWRNELAVVTPPPPTIQQPQAVTAPLRDLLPPGPWTTTDLDDDTRLRVADVDGDGVDDLVVLLSFALPASGEGDSWIALLRGKAAALPSEFPYELPTTLTPVHGNASDFVLADFAGSAALELAVAVPVGTTPTAADGNHVRFFRYLPGAVPAEDRFVPNVSPAGAQVLLAGSEPTLLAASDFDRDGTVDLMVACRGDGTVRVFRNTGAPVPGGALDVSTFVEALSSPEPLAPGEPTTLALGDVNGDGNLDAVAFVEFTSAVTGLRSTSIATYLSAGSGDFDGPRFASSTRIGNRDARLAGDLGDWNRDGVPDLFLGWDSAVDVNLRILFGGTR